MLGMDIKIIASTRIDKFLWAARFYKTRSLATDDIGKGRVKINGLVVKAARDVRAGDSVAIQREGMVCTIDVLQVSEQRGPAPQAHTLYRETEASIAAREPFLDFLFHRVNENGSQQKFRVSGEPMFNQNCRFLGYRGIGVEVTE